MILALVFDKQKSSMGWFRVRLTFLYNIGGGIRLWNDVIGVS